MIAVFIQGDFPVASRWQLRRKLGLQAYLRQSEPDFSYPLHRMMDKGSPAPADDTLEKTLVVQSKMGIHARPAAMIVRLTSRFKGEVFFEKDGEQVNGKSIMGLMMLAAGHGSKITVSVQGAEAAQLVQSLEELFARKFDES